MVFQYVLYITSKKIHIHLPFPQLWQKFASNCILVPHFIQNIFNVFNNSLTAKQKKTYFIKFNFIFIINLFQGKYFELAVLQQSLLCWQTKTLKRADPVHRYDIPTFRYTALQAILSSFFV